MTSLLLSILGINPRSSDGGLEAVERYRVWSVRLQSYVEVWHDPVRNSKQGVVTLTLNAIVEGQDVPLDILP